ncbi:MAG: thiamine-phosphate kinase [Candidatus Omnitrophica bacterium]|nr:thiamine-phosphate kinase [Candidatus Omnitrophota bacterium]
MEEGKIIDWLKRRIDIKNRDVVTKIGDDTAVLEWNKKSYFLLTTDVVVDGIHFEKEKISPEKIGRKALAVNISDIAAMGGIPLYALVSLGLPCPEKKFISGIYKGILNLAKKFNIDIVGGNISKSPTLFIDIFLAGKVEKKLLKLRSSAKPGDSIYVTGSLGGSIEGKHYNFSPRVKEAGYIIKKYPVSSMLDVSDGLSSDLIKLAKASNVGFVLILDNIPVSKDAIRISKTEKEAVFHALNDGEDYELLFTVDKNYHGKIPGKIDSVPVTYVGEITTVKKYEGSFKNKKIELRPEGFNHFKNL